MSGRLLGLVASLLAVLPQPAEAADSLNLVLESASQPTGPWKAQSSVQVPAGAQAEVFRLRVESASEWQPPANYVAIPAGRFVMGTSTNEAKRNLNEGPQMTVVFREGFWMNRYEVTQAEYQDVMGVNASVVKGDDLPVDQVSWHEAVEYCEKLTARERAAGRLPENLVYRLPTEAEWEYACRAGTKTATSFGDRLESSQANFNGQVPYPEGEMAEKKGPWLARSAKVGSFPANAWGLHDMHGNVWEWCGDWYGNRLLGGKFTDPVAPNSALTRTLRGGGWETTGQSCRSGARYTVGPLVLRTISSGLRTMVGRVDE